MKSTQEKTRKISKRIIVEKYLPDNGFRVESRALKYQYPDLKPKMIDTHNEEVLCVGCRGQLAVELLEGEGHRNSMKMKIQELKDDKILYDEGYYQEILSWNDFRLWVLAHPEIMDEWFDIQYGINARYRDDNDNTDDICWEGIVE